MANRPKKENVLVPKTMTKAVCDDNGVALDTTINNMKPFVGQIAFTQNTENIPQSYDDSYEWVSQGDYTITTSDGSSGIKITAYRYQAK